MLLLKTFAVNALWMYTIPHQNAQT